MLALNPLWVVNVVRSVRFQIKLKAECLCSPFGQYSDRLLSLIIHLRRKRFVSIWTFVQKGYLADALEWERTGGAHA